VSPTRNPPPPHTPSYSNHDAHTHTRTPIHPHTRRYALCTSCDQLVDIPFGEHTTLAHAFAAHDNEKLHPRIRGAYTIAMQAIAESRPPISSRVTIDPYEAARHSRDRQAVGIKLYVVRQRERERERDSETERGREVEGGRGRERESE
jgi:hypothetical protein